MHGRAPGLRVTIAAVLLAALYLFQSQSGRLRPPAVPSPGPVPLAFPAGRDTGGSVPEAFRARRSGVAVEAKGVVQRLLADDSSGSRHQQFILRVGEQTVLVAHNVDLAPRVPLAEGDPVRVKGEYEWNERGGVVHWTHRDPEARHAPGWIRFRDSLYQ